MNTYVCAMKVCPWCKGKGEYEIEEDNGDIIFVNCGLCNRSGYVKALNGEGNAYQSSSPD